MNNNKKKELWDFPHHLKQPPYQESHANLRGAREVELVAQRWSKDEVVDVCRDSMKCMEHRKGKCTLWFMLYTKDKKLYTGTSDGEVSRVTDLLGAYTEVLF